MSSMQSAQTEETVCDGACQERLCGRLKQELKFFNFLDEAELDDIAPYFECRQIPPGQYLWKEHSPGNYVALIINGRVEVSKETELKGNVVVGVYSHGAAVGESGLLDTSPRAESVLALDHVDLVLLTRDCFQRLIEEHPRTGVRLLEGLLMTVSRRLKKSFERLAAIF
jgi:CRP/FNR family transcriptional regulator, cyclic AMP receptor protein